MDRIPRFIETLSDFIAQGLASSENSVVAGLPVYAEMEEEHAAGACVRVVSVSADELVPMRDNYRITGAVYLDLPAASLTQEERQSIAAEVAKIARDVLYRDWRYYDLLNDGCNAIVINLFPEPQAITVADASAYRFTLAFRAYVQFDTNSKL